MIVIVVFVEIEVHQTKGRKINNFKSYEMKKENHSQVEKKCPDTELYWQLIKIETRDDINMDSCDNTDSTFIK